MAAIRDRIGQAEAVRQTDRVVLDVGRLRTEAHRGVADLDISPRAAG